MSATPRKTAQSRPRTDRPAAVAMNFDTWAREEASEPFPIVLGGQRYESLDPMDVDFRELNAVLDDPQALFRVLFPDDADEILANKIPLGALAQFVTAITTHFGIEDFIAARS